MKVKKVVSTYGKKKKHKTESIKPRVVINVYNISQVSITNNVTNNFFLGNSTSSGDEFEKLKNIPSYQPCVNVSSKRNNFFQRQDSATFYDSNVTSTLSSSSSVGLFKDAYSNFTSPLFKHSRKKSKKIISKKPVFKRTTKKKKLRLSISDEYKCQTKTISSTPTHPNFKLHKGQFDIQISPIFLESNSSQLAKNYLCEEMFEENEENKPNKRQEDSIDMSKLAAKLDKLNFGTKSPNIKDLTSSRKKLHLATPSEVNIKNNEHRHSNGSRTQIQSLECVQNIIKIRRSSARSLSKNKEEDREKSVYEKSTSGNSSSIDFNKPNKSSRDILESSRISQGKPSSCTQENCLINSPNNFGINECQQSPLKELDSFVESEKVIHFKKVGSPKRYSEHVKDCYYKKTSLNEDLLQPLSSNDNMVSCNKHVKQEDQHNCTSRNNVSNKSQELLIIPANSSTTESTVSTLGSSTQVKQEDQHNCTTRNDVPNKSQELLIIPANSSTTESTVSTLGSSTQVKQEDQHNCTTQNDVPNKSQELLIIPANSSTTESTVSTLGSSTQVNQEDQHNCTTRNDVPNKSQELLIIPANSSTTESTVSTLGSSTQVKQEDQHNCTTQNDVPNKSQELLIIPANSSTTESTVSTLGSSTQVKQEASFLEPNLTSLLPGKMWRRSLLLQKKSDGFSNTRRLPVVPKILSKIAQEANLSCVNDSQSFLNIDESFLRKVSIRPKHAWERNGRKSVIQFKPVQKTKFIENIPEEALNKTPEVPERKSPLLELKVSEVEESLTQNVIKQESFYETPPIMNNSKLWSTISRRKRTTQHIQTVNKSCDNEEYGSPTLNKNTSVASTNVYLESYANEAPNRSSNDMFFESPESSLAPESLAKQSGFQTAVDEDGDLYESFYTFYDENEENLLAPITSKEGFLFRCGVDKPTAFEDVFTTKSIKNCQKIGEGVYGEVFMFNNRKEKTVLKIIPIEGEKNINGAPQKKFDEVLSELITTEELSLLRDNTQFNTTGFCQLKRKLYIQGSYPSKLLDLWHKFDKEKKSYNECPDKLDPDNCFLVLEQEHAGQPVEDYEFSSAMQAYSVFLQVLFSLAVAEEALEFEHRDLHIGNILVKETTDSYISFTIENKNFKIPSFSVKATIIDFTLSRISFMGSTLYYDLAKDPELFESTGDYQFDIYRMMKDDLNNIWKSYQPKTNVRWLHYLLSKMVTKTKYKNNKSKRHHEYLRKLELFMSYVQDFASVFDFSKYLLETLSETAKFVVNK